MKKRKSSKKIKLSLTPLLVAGIALLITISITYAWFFSADNSVNKFKGTQLTAEIDEVFIPNDQFEPGTTTTKEVRVKNTGEATAFVRVSLYEFFLSLQVDVTDQSGNATLKKVNKAILPEVDINNTDTWLKAAEGHGTLSQNGMYYIADTAIISDPKNRSGMYEQKDPKREDSVLNFLELKFSKTFLQEIPEKAGKYWVYENGYFYYLTPLKAGEISEPLLDSISLSDAMPNRYKGALYKLKVTMDAHDLTEPLSGEWTLDKQGAVYPLISGQLK